LKYKAMLSGSIIGDSGEIKGVGLWMTGSTLLSVMKLASVCLENAGARRMRHSQRTP
jgi:hypothetical protein